MHVCKDCSKPACECSLAPVTLSDYKRGVQDALNECLRIQAPANVRWNLQQLLQTELPTPEEYAEGYSHGRQDALREAAAVLRRYGLFTGANAAEAVEGIKR
jgi:hypothetical protein